MAYGKKDVRVDPELHDGMFLFLIKVSAYANKSP